MLTNKDIDKLLKVLATKEDIRQLQERAVNLEVSQQKLLTAMDRLAKAIEDQTREYAAMSVQLSRHEKWIRQIAKQAGVALKD